MAVFSMNSWCSWMSCLRVPRSSGRGSASRDSKLLSRPWSQDSNSSSSESRSRRERRWSLRRCSRCLAQLDTSSQRDWMMVIQCLMTVAPSGCALARMRWASAMVESFSRSFSRSSRMNFSCSASWARVSCSSSGSVPAKRSFISASDSHSSSMCTALCSCSASLSASSSRFVLRSESRLTWKTEGNMALHLGGSAAEVLLELLVLLDERHDRVQVAVHGAVLAEDLVHLVEPVHERLDGVLELSAVQECFLEAALSVDGHGADGGPLVLELGQHVAQGGLVRLGRAVLERLAGTHGRVVGGLLATEGTLELAVLGKALLDALGIVSDALLHLQLLESLLGLRQPRHEAGPRVVELPSLLVAVVEGARALGALGHDTLPAVLHADEKVLDEDHVLLLTEVLEVRALLVQVEHGLAVHSHVLLEGLVLLDLLQDGLHDARHGLQVAQDLLCVRQPVHESLQRVVELGGLLERDLQLDLLVVGARRDRVPALLERAQVVLQVGSATVGRLLEVLLALRQARLHLGSVLLQLVVHLHEALQLLRGRFGQPAHGLGRRDDAVHLSEPRQQVLDLGVVPLRLPKGVLELRLPVRGLLQQLAPTPVQRRQLLLRAGRLQGALAALDQLAARVVERVHGRLVGLDVVDEDLELRQFNLQQLGVARHRLEFRVQRALRPIDPRQQLGQGVLELAEAQQRVLQLPLALHHAAQQLVPTPVHGAQRLPDGLSLVRRGALRQLLSLPAGIRDRVSMGEQGTTKNKCQQNKEKSGVGNRVDIVKATAALRDDNKIIFRGSKKTKTRSCLGTVAQSGHDGVQLIPELLGHAQRLVQRLAAVVGRLLHIIPQAVEALQLPSDVVDGGVRLVDGLVDDVRGGALHRIVGLLALIQVLDDGVVVVDLVVDLGRMSRHGLHVVDLVRGVGERPQHALQLVGELARLLQGLLQGLLARAQVDAQGVEARVVAVHHVLHLGALLVVDQADERLASLVELVEQRLVLVEGLQEHLVAVLLLRDQVGAERGHGEHGHLPLHVGEPADQRGVGLQEVLGERQGLLQDAEAVRAQPGHHLHRLAQVLHLLPDGGRVFLLRRLAQHLLGRGQHVAHASLLARDVVVERLVLLELHADHFRVQFEAVDVLLAGIGLLQRGLGAHHPVHQLGVAVVELLHQGQGLLGVLEQVGATRCQVVVAALQRVQLVLELDGLVVRDVLHEFHAAIQGAVHGRLLVGDLLREVGQVVHLLQQLVGVHGEHAVLVELLLHLLHPGLQVLCAYGFGRLDQDGVAVRGLRQFVGQTSRLVLADQLHEGAGHLGEFGECRLLANDLLVQRVVLADLLLDLLLIGGHQLQVLDLALRLVQPLHDGDELVLELLGHGHGHFQRLHALLRALCEPVEAAHQVLELALDGLTFGRVRVGGHLVAHGEERRHRVLSVEQHLLEELLFLQLGLDHLVVPAVVELLQVLLQLHSAHAARRALDQPLASAVGVSHSGAERLDGGATEVAELLLLGLDAVQVGADGLELAHLVGGARDVLQDHVVLLVERLEAAERLVQVLLTVACALVQAAELPAQRLDLFAGSHGVRGEARVHQVFAGLHGAGHVVCGTADLLQEARNVLQLGSHHLDLPAGRLHGVQLVLQARQILAQGLDLLVMGVHTVFASLLDKVSGGLAQSLQRLLEVAGLLAESADSVQHLGVPGRTSHRVVRRQAVLAALHGVRQVAQVLAEVSQAARRLLQGLRPLQESVVEAVPTLLQAVELLPLALQRLDAVAHRPGVRHVLLADQVAAVADHLVEGFTLGVALGGQVLEAGSHLGQLARVQHLQHLRQPALEQRGLVREGHERGHHLVEELAALGHLVEQLVEARGHVVQLGLDLLGEARVAGRVDELLRRSRHALHARLVAVDLGLQQAVLADLLLQALLDEAGGPPLRLELVVGAVEPADQAVERVLHALALRQRRVQRGALVGQRLGQLVVLGLDLLHRLLEVAGLGRRELLHLGGSAAEVLLELLVLLDERHDRVQVAVHGAVLAEDLVHLVEPVHERLDGVLELSAVQECFLEAALSVDGHGADGGPLVLELGQHVAQGGLVCLGRAVLERLAGTHGRVVGGLLATEGTLELAVLGKALLDALGIVSDALLHLQLLESLLGLRQPRHEAGPRVVELPSLLVAVVEGARALGAL
ncbi:hypothetical protein FOCC_FOCC003027 [Frankliniella occidentalis]|nr:hypothetical protein FOCC_FOCC003027 [Frankliniella occidentalis]